MIPDKILRLRAAPPVDQRFLFHALRGESARRYIEANATGIDVKNISQAKLGETPIRLPPLNEQRRIVEKLDAFFDKSRAAKARLERLPALLEKLHRSILAAAFRGDLTNDWREENPGLIAQAPLPPSIGKDEPTRVRQRGRNVARVATIVGRGGLSINHPATPTPPGWHWRRLTDVARLESGHTPSRRHPEYWNGGIQWLSIPDARDNHGRTISVTTQSISESGLANSSARLLPEGTVCLCRTSFSLGYVVVLGATTATSQDFADWVCSDSLKPRFLMYALLAEGVEGLRRFAKGTHHPTIYYPELNALHINLPSVEEQQAIIEILDRAMSALMNLKNKFLHATAHRVRLEQAALAKAFRGELVPQDPNDEPASILLERIRNVRSAEPAAKRGRGRPKVDRPAKQNGASAASGHGPAAAGEPVDLVVAALLARGRATSADVQDATGLGAGDVRPVLKSLERLGKVAVERKARGTAYKWLG